MAKAEKAAPVTSSASKGGLCLAEGCKADTELADFCKAHFRWFKLGLITKLGTRAKDFDKKFGQHGQNDKTL
jgi:hypothetical protein